MGLNRSSTSLPPLLGTILGILGVILEFSFASKVIFFGIDFYIKFRKAFLEDFDGFRRSFSRLFGSKPDPNPKRRKDETPKFYLGKTYVLEGPGLFIFIKNRLKTMSEREAESEPTFS